ncbi:S10 family peptidase [Parapedobacter koreensis]|uniref:Carboxypeptidase C (Cathepsin A) n=1 Tax=Parapedobacter koreensis TaxID=332977 RepID=A0A1H7G801_9SPHI|nr:carboxypeptidase [Parapedobacter koreensis]SEK34456.1 Carboxypeptidase C (cathepsin A) [Parapedobacter koreensis]
MKHRVRVSLFFLMVFATSALAQHIVINPDSAVTTSHQVTIKGQRVAFKAITGTQPVWDEKGKAVASVFYTYYKRTDVADSLTRPFVVSFNGGPGAGALWMRLGYTGPHHIKIDDEGFPIQPYGIEDNPYSLLDVADIVFVEPVNTGYSRAVGDTPPATFFGVYNDARYLAKWITTFVTRHNRWASPKYLIGESYGTTRVSALSLELQQRHWMYLNGVVLVSPTTLGIRRDGPVADANKVPFYTATAWYHKQLAPDLQQKDLTDILPEVEDFTINELVPALAKGGFLEDARKKEIAAKLSRYCGISEKVILEHNLIIPAQFFWKELLREEGYTVGRLDSRYLGIDREDAGEGPDYSPENTTWQHIFTPANNFYYKNYLNYHTDLEYYVAGSTRPWPREGENTEHSGEDLRQAMAMNPFLHLLVQSGYYDGACDYFNAKYNMWNMDPSGKLRSRMDWKGYRSGHMMYLRRQDLMQSNEDLREFIKKSIPAEGQPAKYVVGK